MSEQQRQRGPAVLVKESPFNDHLWVECAVCVRREGPWVYRTRGLALKWARRHNEDRHGRTFCTNCGQALPEDWDECQICEGEGGR